MRATSFCPGVALFRRPADATFVFCALLAIVAGYLIHRFLAGTLRAVAAMAACSRTSRSRSRCSRSRSRWRITVGTLRAPRSRSCGSLAFLRGGSRVDHLRAAALPAAARSRRGVLAAFSAADFAWNNAPNESTGLPPSTYDALRPDTQQRNRCACSRRSSPRLPRPTGATASN